MQESTITRAVDALTGKAFYTLVVPIRVVEKPKRSLWDRIMRKPLPVIETERIYEVWPCVVANQYRIAGAASTLPKELLPGNGEMLSLVPAHQPTMIYIVAAAIQNNHLEPDKELIQFLERNLDQDDLVTFLHASLQATNMQGFMSSIVLMTGQAQLLDPETSPTDGSELIASHTEQ